MFSSMFVEIMGTARHALHVFVKSSEKTEEDRREEKIGSNKKVHEPKPHKSVLTFHRLIFDSFWFVSLDIVVFNKF